MAAKIPYVPAILLIAAIAANHVVVWFGHDAIIAFSSLLAIIMLVSVVGCLVVAIRAFSRRKRPGAVRQLVVSSVAIAALILDILIPLYPQRHEPNRAMEPTASRLTA